jgi:hypothetical protein
MRAILGWFSYISLVFLFLRQSDRALKQLYYANLKEFANNNVWNWGPPEHSTDTHSAQASPDPSRVQFKECQASSAQRNISLAKIDHQSLPAQEVQT